MVFYAKPNIEFLVSGVIELFPFISNDDSGNTKSTDDRLPGEVSNISLSDFRQSFSLHPLSEVVDSYHQESHLSLSLGELPNYVDSPLL